MDEDAVFKRYDIRGKYPDEIDEEFAERIGKSVGTFVSEKFKPRIVVTKDTKESSKNLKNALIEGILSTGCKVIDAGTGPTDYTAFTGNKEKAVSIQVTSSHLPLEFNGFKFMYPEGNGFNNDDLNRLKQLFRENDFTKGESDLRRLDNPQERYKDALKSFTDGLKLEFDKKIVLDTLGGATTPLIGEILKELGAEVIGLAEGKEKPYRNPPDPKPEMLKELKHTINEEKADLGIATDMDGDRVTVYRNGFLSGDELFAVFAHVFESDIVASIDTSKVVEEIANSYGAGINHTRVGDPFVMEKAIEEDVELAGEPNGHYAFLDFVPYPSGTVAGLIAAGMDLDHYLSKIPDHHVERKNLQVENKRQKIKDIKKQVKGRFELISEIDGVKFRDDDTTVLVRPSGSSPKIRVIVESESSTAAEEMSWKVEKIIRNA